MHYTLLPSLLLTICVGMMNVSADSATSVATVGGTDVVVKQSSQSITTSSQASDGEKKGHAVTEVSTTVRTLCEIPGKTSHSQVTYGCIEGATLLSIRDIVKVE